MTIFVEDKLIGMVVDKVLDVINLPSENLQPPPETEMIVERQFLEGLCSGKEKNADTTKSGFIVRPG